MQRPPRLAAGKPDARREWVRDGHASDRRAPSARAATQPRPGHAAERHALLRLRHDLVQPPRRSARHVGTLRSLPRRAPHRATPRRRATPVRVAGRPRAGLGGGDRSLLLSRDACQLRRRMYSNIPVAAGGEMSERTVEGWVMDRVELREHDPPPVPRRRRAAGRPLAHQAPGGDPASVQGGAAPDVGHRDGGERGDPQGVVERLDLFHAMARRE